MRLFAIPTGTEIALPDVRVDAAWLDDDRVLAQLVDGRRAWLPERGAAPVELAGSHGAEVLQSFGAQLVGTVHHELVIWDVRQPDIRDFVGRTASNHAARTFWSEATRSVLSFNLGAARSPPTHFLLDVWPTEAASAADVRSWAAAVRSPDAR